jgi:metal-responsive CopG/Arc/MetJ family transcriptional regulator
MKTIQMTIDEPLLEEVDRLTEILETTRSAFIRDALQAAIRKHRIAVLEEQHAQAYALHPQQPDEVGIWLPEQVWDEE